MQLALDLDLCGRVGGEEQIGAVLFNAELEVRQDFQHAISSVSTTQRLMTVAASSSRMRMLLTPASSSRFSPARLVSSLTRSSDERRVGKECVGRFRVGWVP